jgi:threonine/homoserine/homoserine lactone efflux protein
MQAHRGVFFLAALPSCLLWLAAGGTVRRVLRTKRASTVFNLTMAALLAGSIVLLIK